MTDYLTLGSIQTREVLHSSGGWRSKTKVPADMMLAHGPPSIKPHMVDMVTDLSRDSSMRTLIAFVKAVTAGYETLPTGLCIEH